MFPNLFLYATLETIDWFLPWNRNVSKVSFIYLSAMLLMNVGDYELRR